MATLEYGKQSRWQPRIPMLLAGTALLIGLAGNALAIWAASSLRYAPTGMTIRPMGVSAVIVLAALATFVLGLPWAILAICRGWRRPGIWIAALLAVVLCVTPLTAGKLVWNRIVAQRGLIIGD